MVIHRHVIPDYDSKWTMNKYVFKCYHCLVYGGKLFHIEGGMWLNALSVNEVLVCETTNSFCDAE